ncbi:MAG TPA: hypothetical protein VIM73_17550 [Polyangiaceae bacterium]
MNHVKGMPGFVLAAALAVGCAAADDQEVIEGALPTPISAAEEEEAARNLGAFVARGKLASAAREIARVEFEDGNVVRFERLGDGLLITEVGPATNPKHYASREETPVEAFRRLAPRREIPAALIEFDRELYPLGAKSIPGRVSVEKVPSSAAASEEESPPGSDVKHTGQFQQSGGLYPYSLFSQNMCNFPLDSPSDFKHGNSTGGHSHIIAKANKAYVAAASDIGDFTIKFCLDNDTNCNAPFQVNPGHSAVLNYDAGQTCKGNCSWWDLACQILGEVKICTPKYRRMATTTAGLSPGERYHDCAAYTEP